MPDPLITSTCALLVDADVVHRPIGVVAHQGHRLAFTAILSHCRARRDGEQSDAALAVVAQHATARAAKAPSASWLAWFVSPPV